MGSVFKHTSWQLGGLFSLNTETSLWLHTGSGLWFQS